MFSLRFKGAGYHSDWSQAFGSLQSPTFQGKYYAGKSWGLTTALSDAVKTMWQVVVGIEGLNMGGRRQEREYRELDKERNCSGHVR